MVPAFVAVGELCMPTNECSKGGGLLATDSYPNISQSIIIKKFGTSSVKQTLPANHCTPLFTKEKALLFYKPYRCLWILSNILQHNFALFCNGHVKSVAVGKEMLPMIWETVYRVNK